MISVLLRVRLIAIHACSARRLRPALSPHESLRTSIGRLVGVARDQARRLPRDCPQKWCHGAALQSARHDLILPLPADRGILTRLRSRSCIIDGEAVACDDDGMPSFDRIRYRRHDASVFLYAFDLIELNGDDLRRDPLDARKAALASVLAKAAPGLRFNEPSRPTVQPCSRTPARWAWRGSCRSARTPLTGADGRPIGSRASPTCEAVKREEEEDWRR